MVNKKKSKLTAEFRTYASEHGAKEAVNKAGLQNVEHVMMTRMHRYWPRFKVDLKEDFEYIAKKGFDVRMNEDPRPRPDGRMRPIGPSSSNEDIEEFIAEICQRLKGSLTDIERAELVSDRKLARAELERRKSKSS